MRHWCFLPGCDSAQVSGAPGTVFLGVLLCSGSWKHRLLMEGLSPPPGQLVIAPQAVFLAWGTESAGVVS